VKKKFTVHLDAILMISVLFIASLSLNVFLYTQFKELSRDNQKLQWQELADSLNLSSQESYIKKLEKQLSEAKGN
jgi:hypothetical protein